MGKYFKLPILLKIAAVVAAVALVWFVIIPALSGDENDEDKPDNQAAVADGQISDADLQATINAAVEGTRQSANAPTKDLQGTINAAGTETQQSAPPTVDTQATIDAAVEATTRYQTQVALQVQTSIAQTMEAQGAAAPTTEATVMAVVPTTAAATIPTRAPTQPLPTTPPTIESLPVCHVHQPIDQEAGVPAAGVTTYDVTVEPGTAHVWASGDVCVSFWGTQILCLPGLQGNVLILMPMGHEPATYNLTGLVPRSNWHGIYEGDCASHAYLQDLVNLKAREMSSMTENCTNGCNNVSIYMIGGKTISADWTYDYLEIYGNTQSGETYTCRESANYLVTIEAGAYSPFGSGGNQWRTLLYIYKGKSAAFGAHPVFGANSPISNDAEVGQSESRLDNTQEEAESTGVGISVEISCDAGEYLRFVPIDTNGAYGDNRGSVTISIQTGGPRFAGG